MSDFVDIFTKSFTLVSFIQRQTQYYKVHGKLKRKGRSKVGALFYYSSLHFFCAGSVLQTCRPSKSLFKLIHPIQIAALNGFRDVIDLEVWLCLQIGDGAGNF